MTMRVLVFCLFQVMIDFQAAERQKLEEPASEIGLEALCAMVCELCQDVIAIIDSFYPANEISS